MVVEIALNYPFVNSLLQMQICDVLHSSELLLAAGLHDCAQQAKALQIKKKGYSNVFGIKIAYLPVSSPP